MQTVRLTHRQEMLASYLTGLAPVGEPFELRAKHAAADCDMPSRQVLSKNLMRLADTGFIEKIRRGNRGETSLLRVKRRLEHGGVVLHVDGRSA